jgi:peptide/nickel transport system permease protein
VARYFSFTRLPFSLPFKGDGLSRAGLLLLTALVLVGLLGHFFGLGGDPTTLVGGRLESPSLAHPFGTDSLGRSMLPRVIEGIGTTLVLSTGAVLVTIMIGVIVGVVAGYRGGFSDELVVRVADVLFSFPAVLLAILVAAIYGPGVSSAVAAVVLVTLPLMVRVVRSATRAVAGRDFVICAEVGGASTSRILVTQLLPNISGPVVVQSTYAISVAMLVESAVSFLGLGVQPPAASLGSLMQEGSFYLTVAPWLVVVPGIVLALAILSVNLLGDSLRDHFEPRPVRRLT